MTALSVHTSDFDREVLSSSQPVLVDFWAPWCGPCRMFAPILDAVAQEQAGKVRVLKVNIDEEPALAQRFGVSSIPSLMLFKNGRPVSQAIGVQPKTSVEAMLR